MRLRRSKSEDEAQPTPQSPSAVEDGKGNSGSAPGAPKATAAPGVPKATADPAKPSAALATPAQARPDPHERIDGLRAWLAQLDRKVGVRTYIVVALIVLALAAGVVALVLTLQLRGDAATNDDVAALRNEITTVQQSASDAAQKSVQSLNQRLGALEDEVSRISAGQTTSRRELKVVQSDIRELRAQVARARNSTGGGSAGTGLGSAGTGLGNTGGTP
jgi:uncharacterized protein HemX